MKALKIFIFILLSILCFNCGNKTNAAKDKFAIKIKNERKTYQNSGSISISIDNKKNNTIDSITYFLGNKKLSSAIGNKETPLDLKNLKLGTRPIVAKVYSEGDEFETTRNITILASEKPKLYTYKILDTYPHDIKAYTQGLEFENDTLYESTGLNKKSSLRKTDYKTGKILKKIDLGDQYFGEGLTILNNKIYQLTWRENTGFIYDLNTFEQTGTFVYSKSKEGWGLCHDTEKNIYKSDGTDKIWTLNSNTLAEEDFIEIYTNTSKIKSVNELEWVDGKIYANVYEQGSIAIIDPKTGAVEGVIDFTDLKDKVTQHPDLNVLNGIAYKGEPNILYITGKNWDKLFKVEIIAH